MEAGRKNDYKEGDLGGRMRKFILGGVAFLALFCPRSRDCPDSTRKYQFKI